MTSLRRLSVESTKDTSGAASSCSLRTFQRLKFSTRNRAVSRMASTIVLPSSPKSFRKVLYCRLAGWSSGSRLASVFENCMYCHCVASKAVAAAIPSRIRIRLRRMIRAVLAQNPCVSFATILLDQAAKVAIQCQCSQKKAVSAYLAGAREPYANEASP